MPGAGGRGLARAAGRGKDQRAKAQAHGVPGQEGGEPRHTEDPKGSGHRLLDCAGLAGADARPGAEGQVRQGAGGSGSGFQLHMLPAVRGWFKRSLTKHVFKSGTWQLDMVTEMIRGSLGRPLGRVRCAGGCAGSCSHGRQVRPAQVGHPEEAGVGGWGVGQGRAACRAMPGQGSPAACACRWGLQGRTAQAGAGKGPKQAAYAVWIDMVAAACRPWNLQFGATGRNVMVLILALTEDLRTALRTITSAGARPAADRPRTDPTGFPRRGSHTLSNHATTARQTDSGIAGACHECCGRRKTRAARPTSRGRQGRTCQERVQN